MTFPKCTFCNHYRGVKDNKSICDAFPDGIPWEFDEWADEDNECNNGIKYDGRALKGKRQRGGILDQLMMYRKE